MSNEELENEKASVWLDTFEGITLKQKCLLLEYFVEPKNIFANLSSNAPYVKAIVGDANYNKMTSFRSVDYVETVIDEYNKKGVKVVSRYSDGYSNLLKQINSPPLVLYCKGDINLLNTFCLSIVGTRHCTHYGADCARKFGKELAQQGITIVSGLATGIDTCAHEGALMGGKTISVFAGGVDTIYPSANTQLAERIAKDGLIVSEFKPDTPVVSYNFPIRNRIIAGLSRGIIIVEASYKSGTMHTKRYAFSENRDIFCIPGNITSKASEGSNRLIQTQEAICVTSAEDILNHYLIAPKIQFENINNKYDGLIGEIYNILELEMTDFETIKERTQEDTKTLNQTLTKMEIMGIIKKLAGNKYVLKS